jgi:hypothetical protein
MTDNIPQAYPLFLAEWNDGDPRFGRIIHWRQDRPRVVFYGAYETVGVVESVHLDQVDARLWIHDDLAELRTIVESYRTQAVGRS